MLDEIRETPDALEHLARVTPPRIAQILDDLRSIPSSVRFIGCGDMSFAAATTAAIEESRGRVVSWSPSMDVRFLGERALSQDTLLVAGSISGRTPRRSHSGTRSRSTVVPRRRQWPRS